MPRRIRLKNFIHFAEERDLRMVEGSYFCIGQNGAGKSALFEAIRRCMSTSKNMGLSSSHNTKEPSIAMCYFDVVDDRLHNTDKDGQLSVTNEVISCIVRLPTNEREAIFKLVYSKKSDTVHVDKVVLSAETFLQNAELNLGEEDNHELSKALNDENLSLDCFTDILFRTLPTTGEDIQPTRYEDETACEKLLKQFIDENLVITYPMRSIAPVQWTNSQKLAPQQAGRAKTEIQDRAEILSWYFDKTDGSRSQEYEEYVNLVHTYYAKITDNCTVRFKRNDGKIIYAYESEEFIKPLGIEKIPEGFYEAMNCAIILAYPGFKTVCLEEPGRGMHPQMVERLRDLILRPMKNKTVVITSHKPAFVAAWNIPRTFFFKKIRKQHVVTGLTIIPGSLLLKDKIKTDSGVKQQAKPYEPEKTMRITTDGVVKQQAKPYEPEKTMRITTTRHFTTLYFARRVLLVEGDGDLLFTTEMKTYLLGDDSMPLIQAAVTDLLAVDDDSKERIANQHIDGFKRFLWPLHILKLDGEQNKTKLERVCKILEIERYFILDQDAIVKLEENKEDNRQETERPILKKAKQAKTEKGNKAGDKEKRKIEETFVPFLEEFAPSYKDDNGVDVAITEQDLKIDVSCLEKSGIFIWKKLSEKTKGSIETALKDLDNLAPSSNVKELLDNNQVTLQWNDDFKERHRHKLFTCRELTDDNIRNVVTGVLGCCLHARESQIFRLIKFLCKMYLVQTRTA